MFIKNILFLRSDFGQTQDQSKFRITSPNTMANDNSWRRKGYLIMNWDGSNEVRLFHLHYLNGFLVSKPNVVQMTNLFKMRFLYGESTIAERYKIYNCTSKRAVLNSGVTKNYFKFDRRSAKEPGSEVRNFRTTTKWDILSPKRRIDPNSTEIAWPRLNHLNS